MADPNDVPRYAEPTPDELARMFGEPGPADALESYAHQGACLRQWGRWCCGGEADTGRFAWMDDAAQELGCADCDEWESL